MDGGAFSSWRPSDAMTRGGHWVIVQEYAPRLDDAHSIHEVFERPPQRATEGPRTAVRVLSLQQRLLSTPADPAVHACKQEAENPSNFASLRRSTGIFLNAVLYEANCVGQ